MQFIGRHPSSSDWQANTLSDGRHTCRYQDLPDLFGGLDDAFVRRGVGYGDCLAFACDNSLASASILMYLLERGHSFVLLPKTEGTGSPVPSFCRYRLSTSPLASIDPAVALQVEDNPVWNGHWVDTPGVFLRTSSSTGAAKLVAYSHANLFGNSLNCVERLQLLSTDRIAIPVPILHMFGLGAAFLPGAAVGAAIDLQNGANLLRYIEREREFNPTVAFMTPIFGETLLKGRRSPRTYRLTVMAGDRMREQVFDRYEGLFGCRVQLYGSTEMGAIAVSNPEDPRPLREQTVGKPLSNVQLRLDKT
ncbi:MAG: AMP-binding protein, partial [Methylococcaceae bacterium]|nr:AMP-binding protein [Methylococcaceae bacterium]